MAPTFRVPAEPLPAAMAYRGSSPEFDGESPRSPRVARVGAAAAAASGVSWSARWSAGRPWRLQLRRDAADADQVRVTFDEDELEWLVSPAGRAAVAEAVRPRPSSWSPKLDGVSLADRGVTEPNIVVATRRVRDGMSSWRHENIEPAPAGAMALVNGRLPVQLVTLGAAADPPLAGDHGETEQAGAPPAFGWVCPGRGTANAAGLECYVCGPVRGAGPPPASAASAASALPRPLEDAASAASASAARDAPAQKKSAASGASPPSVAPPVSPLSLTDLLERESSTQSGEFKQWVHGLKTHVDQALIRFLRENQSKVPFAVPETCSLIPPLAITQASSSGSALSAFREVMNFDNMVTSFSRAAQYEAAGTVWMLDPVCADHDDVSVSQLEGAMGMWTAETVVRSSATPGDRRISFDVPLPVKAVDKNVAQRAEPGKTGVCVPQPATTLPSCYNAYSMVQCAQPGTRHPEWYNAHGLVQRADHGTTRPP